MSDPVNHPSHYTDVVPGIECIAVTEHFSFLRGNAIKYLWRAGAKGNVIEDLRKAAWYIEREIESLKKERNRPAVEPHKQPACSRIAPANLTVEPYAVICFRPLGHDGMHQGFVHDDDGKSTTAIVMQWGDQ